MGNRALTLISMFALGLGSCNASAEQAAPDLDHLREVILETAEECKQIEEELARGQALAESAIALAFTGELDDALALAKTEPARCVGALRYIAFRLAAAGRLDDAARVEKLVERPFWKCRVLVDVAAAYIEAGQNNKAVSCLQRAEPLAGNANSPEMLAKIGFLYVNAGRKDLAKQAFSAAVRLKEAQLPSCCYDPMQDSIYEIQARAGFVEEAIRNASAAKDHGAIGHVAIWQAFSGDIDSAKATAEKCELWARIQALEAIACFEFMAGKRDDGIETLETVLDLAPTHPATVSLGRAQATVAVILAQSGETAKALALIDEIKNEGHVDTSSIEARTEGAVRIASADRDIALRLLSTARDDSRALTPPSVRAEILRRIGLAYHELGMDETAQDVFLDAIERSEADPASGDPQLDLIVALAQAGASDAARKLFEDALEWAGDDRSRLMAVSWSLVSAGFFDEARNLALEMRSPTVLQAVARAQTQQQGADAVLAWIERIQDPALRASALNGLAMGLAGPERPWPEGELDVRPRIAERLRPFGSWLLVFR